jgi:2-hydroxycyclohexanecarboxyl-CoA dehydrogenase
MHAHEQSNGRVALVTGAAGGIGRAIAHALADDGLAVALADVRADDAQKAADELRAAGARALAVEIDVTSAASVAAGADAVRGSLGEVDVLVNNAGWDELKPFLETDEAFWERVLEINFKGALRLTHRLLPGMIERGWGRIVNVASDAGRVGSSLESVYSGAKGGIIAFTKTIARETARRGVTANAVCPGPTDTPLLAGMAAARGDSEKLVRALTAAVPMKRLGQPREVAAAVRFFASPDAGYITGQTLSVSGGLTMA